MLFFCANPLRFEIDYVTLPTVKDSWLRKYVKDNFFHIAASGTLGASRKSKFGRLSSAENNSC